MGKERKTLGIAVMWVDSLQCCLNGKEYEVRLSAKELCGDLEIHLLFKEGSMEGMKEVNMTLSSNHISKSKVIVVIREDGNVYALANRKLELFLLVSNERVCLPSEEDIKDLLHEIITQRNDEGIRAKIDTLNEQLKQRNDEKQIGQIEKAIKAYERLLKLSDAT